MTLLMLRTIKVTGVLVTLLRKMSIVKCIRFGLMDGDQSMISLIALLLPSSIILGVLLLAILGRRKIQVSELIGNSPSRLMNKN